ncbi:MAG TPA: SPOR domain-containing protein [Candidatus Polarisedimenticolaceae bacterium]|nr:SPOR domain-containing protein [Candidatus Polarisedimenticolaceae bacterium]
MQESEPRELRLEGGTLWLGVALLLGALAGAFFLGRWSVGTAPEPRPSPGGAPASRAVKPPADVDASAGGFDVSGVPEPRRQVAAPSSPSSSSAPQATSSGPWNVQVFAGRDRQAAERLVGTLQAAGWPVRLQSVAEGSGSLLKVRVGGYADRAAAEAAAAKLRAQGQTGAWVTDTP